VVTPEQMELFRVRAENIWLKREYEILKKATACFARDVPPLVASVQLHKINSVILKSVAPQDLSSRRGMLLNVDRDDDRRIITESILL
jgi:hypothetical protein